MNTQNEKIALDIESYLKEHENKDMLRFLTCGSVDDGMPHRARVRNMAQQARR